MHTYMIQELAHQHKELVPNNRNKRVIFKNCAPFINCISQINKTQVDDAHDIDVLIPMYKLSEYSGIYSKTSGRLWQYYRDEPDLHNNNAITDFESKITLKIANNGE